MEKDMIVLFFKMFKLIMFVDQGLVVVIKENVNNDMGYFVEVVVLMNEFIGVKYNKFMWKLDMCLILIVSDVRIVNCFWNEIEIDLICVFQIVILYFFVYLDWYSILFYCK